MNEVIKLFLFILVPVLGLVIGSFLNVVIYRLPKEMSLATPPSTCPKCEHKITWYENIPVISWIFLRGKCSQCKNPISPIYPFVELLNGGLWIASLFIFINNPYFIILSCLMSSILICIFFIDLKHMVIHDIMLILLLIIGIASFLFPEMISTTDRVIGFAVGGGFLLLLYVLFLVLTKKEAVGIGDIFLMAIGGLILGWWGIIIAYGIASITSLIAIIVISIVKKRKGEESVEHFPFAPYLVVGIVTALFLIQLPVISDVFIGIF